jgi:hypothetical protein
VFYQLLFSIPLFALGAPVWDAPMVSRVDFDIIAAIVFQALITTAFAFVAWTRLMNYGAAPHRLSLIPVSGVFLAGRSGRTDHGDDSAGAGAHHGRDPDGPARHRRDMAGSSRQRG